MEKIPRVHINKKKYLLQDFTEWIIGRMRSLEKNQTDMGKLLGISQTAFGKRLKSANFDYPQILDILKELQATDEEILRFMKI